MANFDVENEQINKKRHVFENKRASLKPFCNFLNQKQHDSNAHGPLLLFSFLWVTLPRGTKHACMSKFAQR